MILSDEDFVQSFENIPPELLHYIYAANCFQHAIGYVNPILSRILDTDIIEYIRLQPGSIFDEQLDMGMSVSDYHACLMRRCSQENIIPLGNRPVIRDGHRTLAVYMAQTDIGVDHHFSFYNERGFWESKIPFEQPREFSTVREAGLGYGFCGFMLAPHHLMPRAISEWTPRPTEVKGASGRSVTLDEVDIAAPSLYPTAMVFNMAKKQALLVPANLWLPLPAWPPRTIASVRPQLSKVLG